MKLESLVPYWRNPRKNDAAVEKVKASIMAYGYQAPIIVDKNNTIIVGHSRYAALKQLDYTEVQVIVSDMPEKQAKEYRNIDHRSSEYASWSPELTVELKEFTTDGMLDLFFPDVKLDPDFAKMTGAFTQDKIDDVAKNLEERYSTETRDQLAEPMIELPCPNCLEIMKVSVKDILKQRNWTE